MAAGVMPVLMEQSSTITLVKNTDKTENMALSSQESGSSAIAQRLTMGSNAHGYPLVRVGADWEI